MSVCAAVQKQNDGLGARRHGEAYSNFSSAESFRLAPILELIDIKAYILRAACFRMRRGKREKEKKIKKDGRCCLRFDH